MLTYPKIIRSSILLLIAIVSVDTLAASLATLFHFSFISVYGDIMLSEVAALFILAGLMDFSTSIGMEQFKKTFLRTTDERSPSEKKATQQKAIVVLVTGLLLLLILVGLAVYVSQ